MASISHLQGTPWHIEFLHSKHRGPRRDKRRCKYYDPISSVCTRYMKTCKGTTYCTKYRGLSDKDFRARQAETAQIKKNKKTSSTANKNQHASAIKINLNPEQKEKAEKIQVGSTIYHDSYGRGKVIERKDGLISVKYGRKTVDHNLKVLLEKNMIHF